VVKVGYRFVSVISFEQRWLVPVIAVAFRLIPILSAHGCVRWAFSLVCCQYFEGERSVGRRSLCAA
jgi:hypothetical protein